MSDSSVACPVAQAARHAEVSIAAAGVENKNARSGVGIRSINSDLDIRGGTP